MHGSINVDRQMSRTKYPNSTHCAQIITLQPLRIMLRYVIFVLNAIGLALWALTFFEFICANVAKLARKRYLVHDICQSTLILACIDAHPNAPYSPNEVNFEKKERKKSIMTSYCRNFALSLRKIFELLTCLWHQKTKPRVLQFTNSRI